MIMTLRSILYSQMNRKWYLHTAVLHHAHIVEAMGLIHIQMEQPNVMTVASGLDMHINVENTVLIMLQKFLTTKYFFKQQ